MRVSLILEGIRWDDQVEVLDEVTFSTPFRLETSFDFSRIDARGLAVYLYPDLSSTADVSYEVLLKQDKRILQRKDVILPEDGFSHYGSSDIVFSGLTPETDYLIECWADVTDPQTLIKSTVLISSLSGQTLTDYTAQVLITKTSTTYEVTVTLRDPGHNFQQCFYQIVEMIDGIEQPVGFLETGFTPSGEEKTASYSIPIPDLPHYRIDIGVRSQTVYYHQSILETITP